MNRLAQATSPYLLQHADNPVDWREWGEEAFAEARATNRPVLLSIGYAACHWCHVMAHESFEDPQVAAVMNALFVNVKVDREERPDVDHVAMSALHALGQPGGWPLTMFLTPEGAPFWGGTYFPKEPRFGRPGFVQVLREIARLWREEGEKVAANRDAIARALAEAQAAEPAPGMGIAELDLLGARLVQAFDPVDGGLKGAPKFPNPTILEMLDRFARRQGHAQAKREAIRQLERMARGGIRDHLGGGFARYSVDARWLVPHFEKMLYDNAQLLELFALAASEEGDPVRRDLFADAARGIVAWLAREMTTADGAFAASLDADSEGEEGRYYVWRLDEIRDVLGPEDAALFARHYDVTAQGNWEGATILNRLDTPDPDPETARRLARMREALRARRETRVRPGLDDKVLTDWNGLAIAALVRAGVLMDEPGWIARARAAFGFVAQTMSREGLLGHAWRAGRLVHPGFATDHAAMMRAGLVLYEATGEGAFLDRARDWRDALEAEYRVPETGLLAMTAVSATDEALALRPQPLADEAAPNANGLYAESLVRLAQTTGAAEDRERAEAFLARATGAARAAPIGHASILNALDLHLTGLSIVATGPGRDGLVRAALRLPYLGRTVVADPSALAPDHPARAALSDETQAILCAGARCSLPARTPEDVAQRAREMRGG